MMRRRRVNPAVRRNSVNNKLTLKRRPDLRRERERHKLEVEKENLEVSLEATAVEMEQPEDVTLLIKSFLRRECVDTLIKSIRERYPTIPIVVVDDSAKKGEKPWKFDYDENIKTYNLPFDSGLSAGRNHGVANIKTKYFVLLDDDFVFTDKTDLALMKRLLEEGDYDILGGAVREKKGLREYNFVWSWDKKTGVLGRKKVTSKEEQVQVVDCILNFFIARTEKILNCPWDDSLKLSEHTAFFFDHRNKFTVGYTSQIEIYHAQKTFPNYKKMRGRAKEFSAIMKKKRGIKKIETLKGGIHKVAQKKTRIPSQKALKNLLLLSEIFQKNKTLFWLADGTLLGAVRENGFIPHDSDTDLGVLWSSFNPKTLNEIEKQGFKIIRVFGKTGDGFEVALSKDGVKTDLFFYYCREDKYSGSFYHSAYANFTKIDCLKYDFVYEPFQLGKIKFLGHVFPVPENPVKFLVAKYGEDWRTPKKNWSYYKDPKNVVKTNVRVSKKESENELKKFVESLK